MLLSTHTRIPAADIKSAAKRLEFIVFHTPLQENRTLSDKLGASIWLKREDLQVVRSYKLRGAFNKISQLSDVEKAAGVVCASAGNHAQGVAFACKHLKLQGTIYMPHTTPRQKVERVQMFGEGFVELVLEGDTFDDAQTAAETYCKQLQKVFIHPFDDREVIAGQGTVGLEIMNDAAGPIDYLFLPIGGGGLAAGVGSYLKEVSPQTRIIGVEPEGAAAMHASRASGSRVRLSELDKFVDGAAVKEVGATTFAICQEVVDEVVTVPEGKVCSTLLRLYQDDAIVVEPAGALAIAALDQFQDRLVGKRVVAVVSGSNNDITRTEEIRERSLLYEGVKHYFIIRFPQRAGALREFVVHVLGPDDDITHFEYTKKTNREKGPALVGIELKSPHDLDPFLSRMQLRGFSFRHVNPDADLFQLLI